MEFYYGHIVAYEERGKAHKFVLKTIHQDPAKSKKTQFVVFDHDVAFQANQASVSGCPVIAVVRIKEREYEGKIYIDLVAEAVAVSLKDLHKMIAKPAVSAPQPKPPTLPKWETPDDDDIPF